MRISDWSSDVCSSDLVLEFIGRRVEIGGEQAVIVTDGGVQKIARSLIQAFGLELFLAQQTVRFSLIGGKAVDQTDLQALRWWEVFLLAGKLRVIAFGRVDGRCGKDRIEAVEPLAAVPVAGAALGLQFGSASGRERGGQYVWIP